MMGRGREISLTSSGAHLGAGQELSDLPQPQSFQKCSEPRPHQFATTKKGVDSHRKSTP